MCAARSVEHVVAWEGRRTWCAVVGTSTRGRLPLLVLHGGPGAGHDYLESLTALADHGRQVVFYDQFGCGRSDHSDDADLLVMDTFVDEVARVRSALGLAHVHLLGQSWGGMLALEYLLSPLGQVGISSVTLASTMASTEDWMAAVTAQRSALPLAVREVLDRHESDGSTDSREYDIAVTAFYREHVCRIWPFPESMQRSFRNIAANPAVYRTMWGANEFTLTGNLAHWDVRARLSQIAVPALITSGAYDESAPSVNEPMARGIPGAEWQVFQRSAHMAHIEQADEFVAALEPFLRRNE
jgi:L-proline amide hydrolase